MPTFDDNMINNLRKLHELLNDVRDKDVIGTSYLEAWFDLVDKNKNQFVWALTQAIDVLESIK